MGYFHNVISFLPLFHFLFLWFFLPPFPKWNRLQHPTRFPACKVWFQTCTEFARSLLPGVSCFKGLEVEVRVAAVEVLVMMRLTMINCEKWSTNLSVFCHISSHALPFQHDVFSSLSNSGKVLICAFLNELLLIRDEISVHKGRAENSASLCLYNIHSYNTKPYSQVYINLLLYISIIDLFII